MAIQLFYFDYSIGVLLAAVFAAFTFGTLGSDGFNLDYLMQTGNGTSFRLPGGVVFNLANMLLVAAISVAGGGLSGGNRAGADRRCLDVRDQADG